MNANTLCIHLWKRRIAGWAMKSIRKIRSVEGAHSQSLRPSQCAARAVGKNKKKRLQAKTRAAYRGAAAATDDRTSGQSGIPAVRTLIPQVTVVATSRACSILTNASSGPAFANEFREAFTWVGICLDPLKHADVLR